MVTARRMGHGICGWALIVAVMGLGPSGARADEAAVAASPAWLENVSLTGLVTTSYGVNFNRPDSRTNQLRVFDVDDNTFQLDQFELVAQHAVSKPRDSGFRVDLAIGSSVPRVTAAAGLFRESGSAQDIDLHQALVSYIAPLGSGLRLDAGKFFTHHGYEVIDGPDGWNDNATRSLLFGYAIPFTHVGLRSSYTFSPRISATLMLVNGWDVARDNNRAKSVGGQITLNPASRLSVVLNTMIGPELADDDHATRSLLDVVVSWKPTDALSLVANGDRGTEQGAANIRYDWTGYAAYARVSSKQGCAMALRAEYFEDLEGVRTGTGQIVREFTITPEQRLTPHLLVRADYRIDRSDRAVFEKASGLVRTQPTVLVSALYKF